MCTHGKIINCSLSRITISFIFPTKEGSIICSFTRYWFFVDRQGGEHISEKHRTSCSTYNTRYDRTCDTFLYISSIVWFHPIFFYIPICHVSIQSTYQLFCSWRELFFSGEDFFYSWRLSLNCSYILSYFVSKIISVFFAYFSDGSVCFISNKERS